MEDARPAHMIQTPTQKYKVICFVIIDSDLKGYKIAIHLSTHIPNTVKTDIITVAQNEYHNALWYIFIGYRKPYNIPLNAVNRSAVPKHTTKWDIFVRNVFRGSLYITYNRNTFANTDKIPIIITITFSA
jgi:hypothetical protein